MADKPKPYESVRPWTRGKCEYGWRRQGPFSICLKRGRWLVGGEIRCGEHKDAD